MNRLVDIEMARQSERLPENPYTMSVWEVTPDLARELLNRVPEYQRNLKQRKVESYARDILRGHWVLTHQPLAVDEDGNLADGRHRCAAISLADKSIMSYVAVGVPKSAYLYIDAGVPRSISDVTELKSHEAALVRAIFYVSPRYAKTLLSNEEVLNFWSDYQGSLRLVAEQTQQRIANLVRTTAVVNAAIWRSYHHMEFDDFNRLLHMLFAKEQRQQYRLGDGSIQVLRDYLLTIREARDRSASVSDPRRLRYAKTERAIRAYLEGRDISKLLAGDATEIFPIEKIDGGGYLKGDT